LIPDWRLLKRATIDQSYILQHAESRQILFQVREDIPAGYATVLQSSSDLHADDFFGMPDSRAPKAAAIVDPPM